MNFDESDYYKVASKEDEIVSSGDEEIARIGDQLIKASLKASTRLFKDWPADADDELGLEEENEEEVANVTLREPVIDTSQHTFPVTQEELNLMIEELSIEYYDESKYLSRPWVAQVMSQPYKKDKNVRRPFEYSKKKLSSYLAWRTEFGITSKVLRSLEESNAEFNSKHPSFLDGGLYWYGVDNSGCPILWIHVDKTNFENADTHRNMTMSAVVIQSVLDAIPPPACMINVVILSDTVSLRRAMKKPDLTPAFIKLFTEVCPDRLKSAIMVTSIAGHYFYKMVKMFGPKSVVSKVVETKSRSKASEMLLDHGILKSPDDVPDFLGGPRVHHYDKSSDFKGMMKEIISAMNATE